MLNISITVGHSFNYNGNWNTNRDLHTPSRVSFQGCHFEWSWVILNHLAKYSMTRTVARSLCDSCASCFCLDHHGLHIGTMSYFLICQLNCLLLFSWYFRQRLPRGLTVVETSVTRFKFSYTKQTVYLHFRSKYCSIVLSACCWLIFQAIIKFKFKSIMKL